MFQKYKYVSVALIVTIAAILAVVFLSADATGTILILLFFSLSILVLQSISRGAQRSRTEYNRLLSKMERVEVLARDISATEIKKFGENEARLRQVASLVKQIELSMRSLVDAHESEEEATQEIVTADARERASAELKFRLLEDLADVREMVHELKLDAYNRQNQES